MRLLQLFEHIDRLDEAAIDRYRQMFDGIRATLQQIQQAGENAASAEVQPPMTDEEFKGLVYKAKVALTQLAPQLASELPSMVVPDIIERMKAMISQEQGWGDMGDTSRVQPLIDLLPSLEAGMEYYGNTHARDPVAAAAEQAKALEDKTDSTIQWAMNVLGRQDRIVWYLRLYKLKVLSALTHAMYPPEVRDKAGKALQKDLRKATVLMSKYGPHLEQSIADLDARAKKHRSRAHTAASQDADEADILDKRARTLSMILPRHAQPTTEVPNDLSTRLQHMMQMATMIPAIDSIRFDFQTPEGVLAEMGALEEEWQEKMGRFVGDDEQEAKTVIIEFPDGSQWVNLNKRACDVEARSMGHCGNVNWGHPDDEVLSYRVPFKHPETGQEGWEPKLTFILDKSDGFLGEMKGFKNQRPSAKYHPVIVELLKQDFVKGIKGGGHAPENNFSMSHLDPEVAEALIEEKPELGGLELEFEANGRVLDEHLFTRINALIDEQTSLPAVDGWDENTLIVDANAGDTEGVYNTYGGYEGYDDGSWYDPDSGVIEEFISAIPDDVMASIRAFLEYDYRVRATTEGEEIDPEIIQEIRDSNNPGGWCWTIPLARLMNLPIVNYTKLCPIHMSENALVDNAVAKSPFV